ncbi:AsmA family protein [Acetobacter cerevisiae]|uniref:AsmA family protein n=1 Tax=Acetobacter cerevisiae TaxID=178900 RepID=A0ABT1EQE2_9PROT|nr:AsmA family protein [Acetobacter cerevisiae]MCP1245597.1 AsmA family protein [Acetobacter cerevisiae]MCP1255257.1 AsmA family protein [Acetobacter cerevisiae]
MRLKWKIGLVAGAAVLLVGGGSIVSAMQDANWLRVRLVAAVEEQTGRHLTVDQLHVWLLPFPWVEARGVHLSGVEEADAVGSGQPAPNMVDAGEVRARLGLLPLFQHRIVFNDVSIIQPRVSLRRLADGRADWVFTPPVRPDTGGGSPSSGKMHWDVSVSTVRISKAYVRWDDQIRHKTGQISFGHIQAKDLDGATPSFDVQGEKGKGQFVLTGQTGRLLPVRDKNFPVQFKLALTIEGHPAGLAHLDGTVTDPDGARAYALQVGGSLGQLRDLEQFFPRADLPDGQNISVDAQIAGAGQQPVAQGLHVHTGQVELGRFVPGSKLSRAMLDATKPDDPLAVQIDGQLGVQALGLRGTLGTLAQMTALALAPEKTETPVDLTLVDGASNLKLAGTLGGGHSSVEVHGVLDQLAPGGTFPTAENVKVDGHVETASTLALVKEHTPQDVVRGLTLNANVETPHVAWRDLTWTQLTSHVVVQGGRLVADPVQADGSGTAQSARFVYDASGNVPAYEVAMHPVVLPVSAVQGWMGAPSLMQGPLMLVGTVSMQGDDDETRRRTLAGHIGASVVDGSIGGAALRNLLGPDIPLKGKMPVRCFGTHMQIADGAAQVDLLAMETPFLSLHGHGTVGLGTHALDLHLSPRVLLGGASAASDLRVTGTFAAPVPKMEPSYGGRYGLNIGGDDGGNDNCPTLLSAAREGGAGPAPSAPKAGKDGKVMNMLRGLGLFK